MDYVTRANIQRFERMAAGDLDPDKRRILEGLLAGQKTELKAFVQINKAAEVVGGNARLT